MNGPEHYREAEHLANRANHYTYGDGADPVTGAALAAEAQVHATLAAAAASIEHAAVNALAHDINSQALNDWASVLGDVVAAPPVQLETERAVAYVYRATWGTTPLDTYTNAEAARMHCEADAVNHNPEFDKGHVFDWLGDESEPDAPYELVVAKDGIEDITEYTVTRVEVATEYDPEADA